jgi:hypothetical protein
MEVQFRETKNTEVFNKICTQKSKIINVIDESTSFISEEGDNFCFASFQIHMAMGEQFFTEFLAGSNQYMQYSEKSLTHQQKVESSNV